MKSIDQDASKLAETFPLSVVVNGQPAMMTATVGMTMRQVVEAAIEETGMTGRAVDDWCIRDDDNRDILLDEWKLKCPTKARFWIYLGVGKCSSSPTKLGEPRPSARERAQKARDRWISVRDNLDAVSERTSLTDIIEQAIEADRAEVRRAALEEAAKAADSYRAECQPLQDAVDTAHDIAAEEIAGRIRALIPRDRRTPGGTK